MGLIKNGKMIISVSSPTSGEELANLATRGIPGRRAIMSEKKGVSRKTIDRNKTYHPKDLMRDDGRPIEISSIPERVKGADIGTVGTFFRRRSDASKEIIFDQIGAISEHMFKGQALTFDDEGAHTVIIPKFVLPEGWKPNTTPLMIIFPVEYPRLPPTGFYIHTDCVPPADKSGHLFAGQAFYGTYGEKEKEKKWLRENNWAWYCAHIQAGSWSPAKVRNPDDWKYGDNLFTFFTLINEVLNERE